MLRATQAQQSPETSNRSITGCNHSDYSKRIGFAKTESSQNVSHAQHRGLLAALALCRRRRRSVPLMASRQADAGSGTETKLNPTPPGLAASSSPNPAAKLFSEAA